MLGDRLREPRRRAIALVDSELDRLRALGPEGLRERVASSPLRHHADETLVVTHVDEAGDRLLVLVETSRGKRMLATGGFVMLPDGSTYTPH